MDERRTRAEGTRSTGDPQQIRRERRPGETAERPTGVRRRRSGTGARRRSSRAKRRRRNMIIRTVILLVAVIVAVGGFIIWRRYGSSNEKADLKQYYGMTNDNDLAVIVDNQVIGKANEGSYGAGGRVIDGRAYIEYSVLRDYINKKFYWNADENQLLYTLPDGTVSVSAESSEYTDRNGTKSEDYIILREDGGTAYVALEFVSRYTDMKSAEYENPYRVMITCDFGERTVGTLKRDTEVRYQAGVKSPILTPVKKSDKVTVIESEGSWKKVRTEDGFIGYLKESALKDQKSETGSSDFEAPVYTNISKDYKINMAWHNVDNSDANNYLQDMIADADCLNTIAPTWFHINDTNGNIESIADSDYVARAHEANLEVWAVLRDFHGGINSAEETYEVLSSTSKRANLINQITAAALQNGIDGINLDFELISEDCGEHYLQFIRELSVRCRQNNLVFSVDNYVPMSYNYYYDIEEQASVVDYVVIMGYDEHTEGSEEAGSVASYGYVKNGIENALQSVSKDKLIEAVPFYTRLWFEESGQVTSTALGMDDAVLAVQSAGAQTQWDEETRQNYAQWEADGGTYKIWLEDESSLKEKLDLISDHDLAGVAEWRLGWENSGVWKLFSEYVK